MKILNTTRGYGKSTMLLTTSHMTGIPIIVSTKSHQNYLENMAKELDLEVEVYNLKEYRELSSHPESILIDDADSIIETALEHFFGCHITGITMSIPEKSRKNFEKFS